MVTPLTETEKRGNLVLEMKGYGVGNDGIVLLDMS